jgi:hypothetical protein
MDLSNFEIFVGIGALVGGAILSFSIVSHYIYEKPSDNQILIFEPTKDMVNERKHKLKCVSYGNKYYDELEKLDDRELTSNELKILNDSVVEEETPEGVVIMSYNHSANRYEYYTDNKKITHRILDAVCRKFAITYDCKEVCINHKQEIKKVREKLNNPVKDDSVEKKTESINDVFIKQKPKKNTGTQSKKVVLENMNFFSRKGDLRDYNEIIDNKNAEDKHKMTFAEYKKLNESNKLKHL